MENLQFMFWVLLATKAATSQSSQYRKYPAAWIKPTKGRAPWLSDKELEREKWNFSAVAGEWWRQIIIIKHKESGHT